MVASEEIESAHGLPIDVSTFGAELKFVTKVVNAQKSTKEITPKSSSKYTCSAINRVNRIEYGHYKQRRKSRTGLVKVSIMRKNRVRQSDPRLAWLVFHKIAQMYRDIRKQESKEATELIIKLHFNLNSNHTSSS